jgi:hypothetical protein
VVNVWDVVTCHYNFWMYQNYKYILCVVFVWNFIY